MAFNNDISNSRKSSFTGSLSSNSSSFINIEDDRRSMISHIEINQVLSNDDGPNIANCSTPFPPNFGSRNDLSEVETPVDSDCEDCNLQNSAGNLRDNLFDSIQNVFEKQNPKKGLFDIVFLVDNKEIYVHKLILYFRGATKVLEYIKLNGAGDEKIQKINMNIGGDNPITYDDLYIFTKSLYFRNVGTDLTPINAMSILSLAKRFGIQSLMSNCHIYLTGSKWGDDALTLLEKAISYSEDEIISRCLNVISKKTQIYLSSPKLLEIKHATLVLLLQKRVFKTDAKTLFDKVYEWATKNSCNDTDDSKGAQHRKFLGEALTLIPFEKMEAAEIYEIYDKGILTPTEALLYLRPTLIENKSPRKTDDEDNAVVASKMTNNHVENPNPQTTTTHSTTITELAKVLKSELKPKLKKQQLKRSVQHPSPMAVQFPPPGWSSSSQGNSNRSSFYDDGRSMATNRKVSYDGPNFLPRDLFTDS